MARAGLGALPLLGLFLSSCVSEPTAGIQTEVRDSAGITIAESSALPEAGAGGWLLGQDPIQSIGVMDGDSLYQLFGVTGGLRLADGRIVVTDRGSYSLRVFDPDGAFHASHGRQGEGPGEFRHIQLMGALEGDTLVVLDGRQRRISLFHPEGGFLSQNLILEGEGVAFHSNGMFGDGSIVFGGGVNVGRGDDTPRSGYERVMSSVQSIGLDGLQTSHFGEFSGGERIWSTVELNGRETRSSGPPHFGKTLRARARGDRLALSTRDRYEVMLFSPSGELIQLIRVDQPPIEVTPEHLDGLLEERLARLPNDDDAPYVRTTFRETPSADYMPSLESLLLDSEGYLWVEDIHIPGESLRNWTVFDRDGVPRTRLSLPRTNRVLEIGEDYLLTVFRDELDVEYLRVYPLARGEG